MAKVEYRGVRIEKSIAGEVGALYDGGWRAADPVEDFRVQWPGISDELIEDMRKGLQAFEDCDRADRIECFAVGDAVYYNNHDGTITAEYDDGSMQDIGGQDNNDMWKSIVLDGADPVADGWEDGCGHPVCKDAAHRLMEEE